LRDRGREAAIKWLESRGWHCLPYPASGAGRPGIHRPDLLVTSKRIDKSDRVVLEVKHTSRLPIYVEAAQIEALKREAFMWEAFPELLVKVKSRKDGWKVIRLWFLKKTAKGNFKVTEEAYDKALGAL